ncbi:hypothetical protein NQ317_014059 [Molorchus minor]|uniref:Uncharacterized protein n=1 Tax=Molorchus minor TaxID=1323400 RepID=A0ABQ9J1L9_9CUCU|nr:hypothetical protein NQ317_014059 [Molorchus minor]
MEYSSMLQATTMEQNRLIDDIKSHSILSMPSDVMPSRTSSNLYYKVLFPPKRDEWERNKDALQKADSCFWFTDGSKTPRGNRSWSTQLQPKDTNILPKETRDFGLDIESSGQEGNEIADSLARKGAETTFIGPERIGISYNTAKMAVLNWSEGEILQYCRAYQGWTDKNLKPYRPIYGPAVANITCTRIGLVEDTECRLCLEDDERDGGPYFVCMSCGGEDPILDVWQSKIAAKRIWTKSHPIRLSVIAHDQDQGSNGEVRYNFGSDIGDTATYFTIDSHNGWISTIAQLDKETKPEYKFYVTATDNGTPKHSARTTVIIRLKDYNDSPTMFKERLYKSSVIEDALPGTVVLALTTKDADRDLNTPVEFYIISGDPSSQFHIRQTGELYVAKSLDREKVGSYNLEIIITDGLFTDVTKVEVTILDANVPISSSTIRRHPTWLIRSSILAVDIDGPEHSKLRYILTGDGSENFLLDKETGHLKTITYLDRENQSRYLLTAHVHDKEHSSWECSSQIELLISDLNDNAPLFSLPYYSVALPEDVEVGTLVTKIHATDADLGINRKIKYAFIDSFNDHFVMASDSGIVTLAKPLDRELRSMYNLSIQAVDQGTPQLSSAAHLIVNVQDINDNPPEFETKYYLQRLFPEYKAIDGGTPPLSNVATVNITVTDCNDNAPAFYTTEDKPLGYPILKFHITDLDAMPNTEPYTFDFKAGNEANYFRLDQDGILRTATKFNHKIRNTYLLQIRVFDNGSPPLYSDTWVIVKVIEESQYPPIITPLEININSYLDEYPGGIIGKVYANDQDQYDTLTYSLSPTAGISYPTHELFQINRTDGTLTALPRLDVGEYRLNVSVTDGKFYTHTIVKVNVEILSEDMLENSVGIRFRDVRPEVFILSSKDVIIISVQPSIDEDLLRAKRYINKDLDVLFTVRKPDEGFFSSEIIRKALNDNLEELEESTKLVVEEIIRPKCNNKYCVYGVCQDHFSIDVTVIEPVSTDVTSFVSPMHARNLNVFVKKAMGAINATPLSTNVLETHVKHTKYVSQMHLKWDTPASALKGMLEPSVTGKSYSQYRIINKKSIEDQLSLSLRIRTVQPTGNLMHAAGKVDYNVLEIVNGAVQYRFELGSGEGIVRVSGIYVSDGSWHEIKLERDRNNAKITIDGTYTAQGSAPGVSDILNLQSDEMYLGAEVHQHPSILGFEDVQRGFSGCMDDIRISRVSVPLHKSGENSVVVLKRFANVEFSCDTNIILTPPGPCGSQPCMNGGTCRETKNGYECDCHARYQGTLCELDTDPCASAPCLYGGKCTPTIAGDFVCECVLRLSGKRCEYGRYCSPNPCKHGGVCEEGDDGPLCKCRSFAGEFCEYDLNECESSPCQNGGTCINEIGSFHCICPSNVTGPYCANLIYNTPISTTFYNITWEELIYFGIGAGILLLLIIMCISCRCYFKKARRRNMANNENLKDNIVLNSTRPHEMSEFKRGSKLSNLEVNQREIPICPPRPVSYTPSSQNDPIYNCNATVMLNNLDTLRSYGSAGDELENVPPDYLRNLNRSARRAVSAIIVTRKRQHYKISSPVNSDVPNRLYGGRSNTINNIRPNGPVCIDEEQRSMGSYHWDCSDWARHSQTLPNITEVPGSEIPDSSSFHSNESNESRCHLPLPVLGPLDPHRDIETLNEDVESEFMADTECDTRLSPSLNALDSGNEEYRFTTADSYIRHPNSYLPTHGYNIPSEVEGDCLQSPGADSDDVEPYGFPSNRNRRKHCDDDISSVITTLEERHSLLGGYASNSDLSTNLCEIEDSECEIEQKPLNYLGGVQQTSV